MRVKIDLTLRSQQIDYLEYCAERGGTSLSRALDVILFRRMAEQPPDGNVRRGKKKRKTFSLPAPRLAFLDELAARAGLERSDMARRLIDDALARDTVA